MGELPGQSDPSGRVVISRDNLELVVAWQDRHVTIELGVPANAIAEEPSYGILLEPHEAAYLAGVLTMAAGVRLG